MFSPGLVGGRALPAAGARCTSPGAAALHYLHYNVDAQRSLGYWELRALVTYAL